MTQPLIAGKKVGILISLHCGRSSEHLDSTKELVRMEFPLDEHGQHYWPPVSSPRILPRATDAVAVLEIKNQLLFALRKLGENVPLKSTQP